MCAQTLLARAPVLLQERDAATRVLVRASFASYVGDLLLAAGATVTRRRSLFPRVSG